MGRRLVFVPLPGSCHENPEGRGERCMARCRLKVHSGLAHRAGLSRDIACTGFAPLAGESTGSVSGRFAEELSNTS